MFMKQVVQKWNCLYCFTETHFICKNTAISSKKKNLGGDCKEGDKLDKNELLSFECENLNCHTIFEDFAATHLEEVHSTFFHISNIQPPHLILELN